MVLSLVELWQERLAHLDERCATSALESRHLKIERRVLAFLVRRYGGKSGAVLPSSAQPLDPESSTAAAGLRLSADARERLVPGSTESSVGREFRSADELAEIDLDASRRLEYRRNLVARVSFLTMAFLMLVLFIVSAYVIVVVLAI